MMPALPEHSRRSGPLNVKRGMGLSGVATVATTFINLNKKKGFRTNFSDSCGNSGNQFNCFYIGDRLIEKIVPSRPPSANVIKKLT